MAKTAILVDGGFYRKRAELLWGKKPPEDRALELRRYCQAHIKTLDGTFPRQLYRVFYYDCPPINKKIFHPFLNRTVDFGKQIFTNGLTNSLNNQKTKEACS